MLNYLKNHSLVVLLLLCLWGCLVGIDRAVIGTNYAHSMQDLEIGWFSWMINWQTGDPWLVWYTPASTARIINGLWSLFIDVDLSIRPIKHFIVLGIVGQGVFVLFCAVWFSWITNILHIHWRLRLLLVVIFFSYPTLLFFVGHSGFYFELWLLGLPLGLTLFEAITKGVRGYPLGGAGCGLLLANYYPSGLIVLVFLFVVCLQQTISYQQWPRWLVRLPYNRTEIYIVALLGLCFIAWLIGYAFGASVPYSEGLIRAELRFSWMIIAGGVVMWLATSYLTLVLVRWIPQLEAYVLWLLLGFVGSASVLLPWYWDGLFLASSQGVFFWDSIKAVLVGSRSYPWFGALSLFILILYIVFFHLCFKMWQKKDQVISGLFYVGLFAALGMLLSLVFAGSTAGFETGGVIPGGPERGFLVVAPFVSAGTLLIARRLSRTWSYFLVMTLLVVNAYVSYDYYRAHSSVIAHVGEEGSLLDFAIESFLSEDSSRKVVCVGDEHFSRYCAVAYAYNRYRTPASIDKFPSRILLGGRLVSLNAKMPDAHGNWDDSIEQVRDLLFPVDGALLIVTRGGWFRDQLINLSASEGLRLTPFWRWWNEYLKSVDGGEDVETNVQPGEMFIVRQSQ